VNQLFLAGLREMPGRKKMFHFACQFEALGTVFGFAIFHFQVPQTGTQSESTLSGQALWGCVWEKGAGLVRSILTCSHPEYTKTPSNLGICSYFLI
jgi:hypothetical protein